MTARRFPRGVYQVGNEPDPRFSLANERTFLAWIRTSLGLLAVGVAIEALRLEMQPVLRFIAAMIFVVLAVIAGIHAWFSWARHEKAMRLHRALPGPSTGIVLVVGVVLATLLLVVGMLL